jgi:hypothetical protein
MISAVGAFCSPQISTQFYGFATAALNQAVKRNKARFPADFCFSTL